jgi:hypothetical protein
VFRVMGIGLKGSVREQGLEFGVWGFQGLGLKGQGAGCGVWGFQG